ncbi:hypothetical protein IDH44_01340 [Paenibacillus sp. IB182496]|uniref:GGDEF domain-containing protein n=1 Tax=Paenibacillus sabuli TaxID=2772509 RepID=A0A927BNK2_9BACL|nr:hypothetical protein [Paenibacillus sabuli]MBD2843821.1 hypothetical protein [Paenibacillus sabuli]
MTDGDNQIAIGLIGPEAMLGKVLRVISDFPSFRPVTAAADTAEQAAEAAQRLLPDVEVLMLTGPGLLHPAIKEMQPERKPIHVIPLTDTGFLRAFYQLQVLAGVAPSEEAAYSIDSLASSALDKLTAELDERQASFIRYDQALHPGAAALVEFHERHYRSGRSRGALTAEHQVMEILGARGVPCGWITPSSQNIVVALERALLSTETRRGIEAQIVVGMLNVDDFGKQLERHSSEHEIQRFKLDVHRTLIDYVESLDGYLIHLGSDDYLFFTTRGIFERETGGYKSVPLAREISRTLDLSLSMGIGFGRSANEAGTHARLALRHAKEAGGNACFIVREDKTRIGPLEMTDPIQVSLSLTDSELLRSTEDAGMTSAYLSRLLHHVGRTGRLEYEVHELSEVLDVTVRSTHRLVQQWTDHGLVRVAGYVKVPKGRPKQVFRLSFLETYEGGR